MKFSLKTTFIASLMASACFGVEAWEEAAISQIQTLATRNGWSSEATNHLADALRNPQGELRIYDIIQGNVVTRLQHNQPESVTLRENELTHIENQLRNHRDEFEAQVVAAHNDNSDDAPGAGAIALPQMIPLNSGSSVCPGLPNTNTTSFENLPPEIFHHIISFLGPKDLRNLMDAIQNSRQPNLVNLIQECIDAMQFSPEEYQLLSIPLDDVERRQQRKTANRKLLMDQEKVEHYTEIITKLLLQCTWNWNPRHGHYPSIPALEATLRSTGCDLFELFIYWIHLPIIRQPNNLLFEIQSVKPHKTTYFYALITLYNMQEESFRANNPFWCIVFDVMSLGLDESTRPLIQQFPYQPYLQAERYNLSEVYEWYYSTNAILADDNQATAYDHLGLNALCYALQFLLRNAAGTRLVDIREDGTAVFIGSMLFNFLINRGIRFNRSVTRDGLSFVQYAERFLNHPEFPLHIEDYNFFLRTYNPPLEIPAPQLIVEEPAPQVDDAQVEEPAPQVDELQPALELIVPALHEPAININEGMHPRFFQNNTTRLSLLVLILSLVAGIGYTSM